MVLLLVVLLGVVLLPAAAAPISDLNALAQYFPSKTPVLASFRTDADYLDTLDALSQRLQTALPDADIIPLRQALDEAIAEAGVFGSDDFETVMRPWLGDVASLGVISLDMAFAASRNSDDTPFLLAVQVTNRAAAEAFWDRTLTDVARFSRSTDGDFTVYTPPAVDQGDVPFVAVGNAVMFISSQRELLPLSARTGLNSNETFVSTLALLPESDYNISIFMDLGESLSKAIAAQPDVMQQPGISSVLPLLQNLPPQAIGFTILDERSFVMDIAQPFGALLETLQAMDVMTEPPGAVNPAFAGRIPAGTPLVIHATDLGSTYRQAVASFRSQVAIFAEAGGDAMPMPDIPTIEDFDRALAQFKVAVQGVTGLNFDEELLPALNGDYALYLGLNPALAEASGMRALMQQLPVDFGVLIAIDDPAVIDTLVAGLTNTFEALPNENRDTEITLGSETIGSETVTIVTIRTDDVPFPIELVIGGDDEVFFLGTPDAARASLNPDGTLLSDPAYQEAAGYLLSDPRSVAYLSSGGLLPLANVIRETGGRRGDEQAADFLAFLSLLNSASISQTYVDDVSLSRAVWTLPSE